MKKLLLLPIFLLSSFFSFSQTPDARTVLNKMFQACNAATRFSATLVQEERFDLKVRKTKQTIQVSTKPTLKAYIKITDSDGFGENGTEICYPSKNDINKACLMTFMARTAKGKEHNVYDNVLCEKGKQHHPMIHIGFQYLTDIINFNLKKDSSRFYKALTIKEQPTYYELTIEDSQYNEGVSYKVKGVGDFDIASIAKSNGVSQYKVYELNKDKKLDYLTPLKAGDVVKIPSTYARRTVLYINKSSFLPLTQIIYDTNPTVPYERYIFEGYDGNPKFNDSIFKCD